MREKQQELGLSWNTSNTKFENLTHLDWVRTYKLQKTTPCSTLEEIEEYSNLLEEIKDYSWVRLEREAGCYVKCRYKEYKFNKVKLPVNVK